MVRRGTLQVLMALALIGVCSGRVGAGEADRTLVVLLFDGLAPALVEAISMPALDRMRREGAWTHELILAFPTLSLVNQVTLSTGCWPAHHGIVANVFLDPERGRFDHAADADWLTGCEHLHETAERRGVRSAALGWVGRQSSRRGKLATYVSEERTVEKHPPDGKRAEAVVQLLQMPDSERPRLILAYFRGPDEAAHRTGIDSEETRKAVSRSGAAVERVMKAIDGLSFRDRVTLIVTTDHGMRAVSTNVNVARILQKQGITARALSAGTTAFLYLDDPDQVDAAVRKLSRYRKQFDVERKTAQPPDWHLGTGPRVGDVIISARPPYFIEDVERWPWWSRWLARWGPEFLWAGRALEASHGYPPDTPGMKGVLYAWGAGIASHREIRSMAAIDLNPTACRLLGIEPAESIDGMAAERMLR